MEDLDFSGMEGDGAAEAALNSQTSFGSNETIVANNAFGESQAHATQSSVALGQYTAPAFRLTDTSELDTSWMGAFEQLDGS